MSNLKMPDINNVLIAGNLTCDPSFRKTTNGTPVANFFIASNRKFIVQIIIPRMTASTAHLFRIIGFS